MKNICLFSCFVLMVGCGSITVSPHLCKTQAIWTSEEQNNELILSEDYFLGMDDQEVKIKDMLEIKNIKCDQLKTMRLKIHTTFFVKRTVEIYYTLN
jgi:hypothetical protein